MSESWNPGVKCAARTDVGLRRTNNQDSHTVITAQSPERFSSRGHLFVVADGMGAHAAGELASRMAAELIPMHYFRAASSNPAESLRVAVVEANTEIYQRGQQNPEFHNMGTTASVLALLPTGAWIAHVGDSRVYRLRAGVLEQMTFDHSLVWEVEASGQVHPESALGQSLPKNVITRSLGPNAQVQVDMEGPFELQRGDRFLLCSDGLSGQVEDVEIATLLDCLPEQLAVEVLVDLANLRGGPDNTTVVVASVTEGPLLDTKMAPPEPAPSDQMAYWGTAGALAATALCLIGAVAFWQLDRPVSMLITLGGALIAGVISASSLSKLKKHSPSRGSSRNGAGAVPPRTQQSPYRRYAATPDQKLFDRLGKTIEELREAAKARNWLMEWEQIEQLQHEGAQAMQKGEGKHAILAQSKAIVETMHQLREQHNRSAGETAIDQ